MQLVDREFNTREFFPFVSFESCWGDAHEIPGLGTLQQPSVILKLCCIQSFMTYPFFDEV